MARTGLLALLLAAAASVAAAEEQRFGMYARLVATDPAGTSVMVERADGQLWVYRLDAAAAREIAGLSAGDEVVLTFVYDGPGSGGDDVIRDVERLATPTRAGFSLPFGVLAGTTLRDAGQLRTATTIRPRSTAVGDGVGVDADLAVPGPVVLDGQPGTLDSSGVLGAGGVVGGTVSGLRTADGLLPGLSNPGPVLIDGRNLVAGTDRGFTSAVPGSFASTTDVTGRVVTDAARPQAAGSFTPGNVAPNVENPNAGNTGNELARPAADTPFTPGVVTPGVRDAAAGRGGVRGAQPNLETGFTPGTVAPGVRDPRVGTSSSTLSTPGRETIGTTGVPATLVPPQAVNGSTGGTIVGTVGGTGTTNVGTATTAAPGTTTVGGTPLPGARTAPTPTGHGAVAPQPGVPSGGHAGTTTAPAPARTGTPSTGAAGVGSTTGTTGSTTGSTAAPAAGGSNR
jgi:hypothetical protein